MRKLLANDSLAPQDTTYKPKIFPSDTLFSQDTSAVSINKDSISRAIALKPNKPKPQITEIESVQIAKEPDFCTINYNSNTLINNYLNTNWFNKSHDKIYYLFNKQGYNKEISSIFVESNTETKSITTIEIAPKETSQPNTDWYIIPVLTGAIIFAFAYNVYRKYFGQLYESVIFRFITKKLVNDRNITFKRFSIILDFLFIITFSLSVDQIMLNLNIYAPPKGYEFLVALIVSVIILSIKVLRFFIFRVSSLITSQRIFLRDLYINSLIYTRVMGLILLPIVFLVIYSVNPIAQIFVYISIFIISIVLIFRMIRTIKVFIDNGLSIFYFILYLCALEIVPLLVIWKEVQAR